MRDAIEHWRLCKISHILRELSPDEPDEWNGIFHLPTDIAFRITGNKAEIVALGMLPDSRLERRLKRLAVKRFKSCQVSYRPEHRVTVKRGRQYVM